jgi:cathepsin D
MGLAFESIAKTQAMPFWQALLNGRQLQSPEMSFALTRLVDQKHSPTEAPGGTFTLGGTNPSLFTGEIDFSNTTSDLGFWSLTLNCWVFFFFSRPYL